jgi:hypothetical protein
MKETDIRDLRARTKSFALRVIRVYSSFIVHHFSL